jgi:hypothetical protein
MFPFIFDIIYIFDIEIKESKIWGGPTGEGK